MVFVTLSKVLAYVVFRAAGVLRGSSDGCGSAVSPGGVHLSARVGRHSLAGLGHGVYASFKTLRLKNRVAQAKAGANLLMFWTILSCLSIHEQFTEALVSWLPMYYVLKCGLLGGLILPQIKVCVWRCGCGRGSGCGCACVRSVVRRCVWCRGSRCVCNQCGVQLPRWVFKRLLVPTVNASKTYFKASVWPRIGDRLSKCVLVFWSCGGVCLRCCASPLTRV